MFQLKTPITCVVTLVSLASSAVVPGEPRYVRHAIKRAESSAAESSSFDAELELYDNIFYIEFLIGSPAQDLFGVLDTFGSDLWVNSNVNPYCLAGEGIDNSNPLNITLNPDGFFECDFPYFNSSASDSFKQNTTDFQWGYEDSTILYGRYGSDNITVGDVTIDDFTFAVTNFTNQTYAHLGIGYPINEGSDWYDGIVYSNYLYALVNQGKIEKPAYSLYLNKTNSEILFGALDESKYKGDLTQFEIMPVYLGEEGESEEPIITSVALTLTRVSSIYKDKVTSLGKGYYATIIDTSTPYAILPEEFIDAIATAFNLEYDDVEEQFSGDCEYISSSYLSFSFQEVEYTIPAAPFFREVVNDNESVCYFEPTIAHEDDPYIYLGNAFLQYFYIVADLESNHVALAYIEEHPGNESIHIIDGDDIPGKVEPESNEIFGAEHNGFVFANSVSASASEVVQTTLTVSQHGDFGETASATATSDASASETTGASSASGSASRSVSRSASDSASRSTSNSAAASGSASASSSQNNAPGLVPTGYTITMLGFLFALLG